ncbi:MAG: carotenoid 1,2-hydratase [Steroidobacteraceae bacterium]
MRRAPPALLAALLAAAALLASDARADAPSDVVPGYAIAFPRDHGAHPTFRTEWWYVTGWLRTAAGEDLGFQVTFFRTRPDIDRGNPSAFTPQQIVIAHAALSDTRRGRLWKMQRVARAGFGLAGASETDTAAWIDADELRRTAGGYRTRMRGEGFAFELELEATQPPLLNGERGYSRKGPAPLSASYYYSVPQLRVRGRIERDGRSEPVSGDAWLDHEWSSAYLDAEATGWDWVGINLAGGGAFMAFRIRDRRGATHWAGGTLRAADGTTRAFAPRDVEFVPGRRWKSPRTGTSYPVSFRLRAGSLDLELEPLLDDQESDTRGSTGAVYWEGAVRARAAGGGAWLGRGYLELTGYGNPLALP